MSDVFLRRIALLIEIAENKQRCGGRLGKTAMQKLLYLLQDGYGVHLGYRFDLYTYGPYESAVMRDIDYAAATGLLEVSYDPDKGYEIKPGACAAALQKYREALTSEAGSEIRSLMDGFGPLSAAELELRGTILYVLKDAPELNDEEVITRTIALKPRFDTEHVRRAFKHLSDAGLINRDRNARSTARAAQGQKRSSHATISTAAASPARTARRRR